MVNIVYEVLFSSTLAHKKFSICLTCNMAVHRYFLQLSKSSLCHFSERDKFWRERKTFSSAQKSEKQKWRSKFLFLSLAFPILAVFRKKQRPSYVCQLPPDFFYFQFHVMSQVRIQDLVKGGPQLLRPKVANVAKRSHASEVSILRPGSRACLRALEAFGFLMLKYAFSHILETLFLLFLTSILTPKVDKNRALDFTSINLRHSDMLHLFFNLHEKVML